MKGLNKDEIFKLLKENKVQLIKYNIKRIGLFGSFIRGDNDDNSDVDFMVVFEEGKKNFDNFIGLVFFLEKILDRKVDLLTIESLSPYMKTKILKETHFETI